MGMTSNDTLLPRILCFHGGGTSALIFSFQTRKLQHALRSHFHLVFVNAPVESEPGPGVVPVFESAGPFFQWIARNEEDDGRVRLILQRELHKQDGGPVVGVLGFSQGTRVAAGLLQEQELTHAVAPNLRFGVFLNGAYPPMRQLSNPSTVFPPTTYSIVSDWDDRHEARIHLPSVHVHGKSDVYLKRGQLLARCFDPSTATILEFENGHHLPVSDDDTKTLADEILRIYRNA